MATSVLLVLMSFCILALAWYLRKQKTFHITAMSAVMLFDVCFPIYLYLTHDWWKRLVEQRELFSFLIWSHLILIMVLYSLYVLQILAGRAMLQGSMTDVYVRSKEEHRKQFFGIVIVRLLVFATGALLIVPTGVGG